MHPSLRGYTIAVMAEAGRLDVGAQVADELTAVAHLLSRTNDLAVTMSDFAVPEAARRAVLRDLLSSRVHPLALQIALHAVQSERPEELMTSLHNVYELARHLHDLGPDQVQVQEPALGRTAWRQFASGYSAAVFEALTVPEIETEEEELFRFARIVEGSPSLRSALADPTRPAEERRRLLNDLLAGKVTGATVELTTLLTQGHVRDVVASLDWLVELAARARGWRVARVRTARPIGTEEQEALARAMEHLANNPVELQITDDPELLGGAVIQIGDLLVDASARHRLEQLQEHLLETEGTTRGAQS